MGKYSYEQCRQKWLIPLAAAFAYSKDIFLERGEVMIVNVEISEINIGAGPARKIAPEIGCALAARLAASASRVEAAEIAAQTRHSAQASSARQIGMYLAHTVLGLPLRVVGEHFGRDRTTASHACRLVEDRRDDRAFDDEITELERLLRIASGLDREVLR